MEIYTKSETGILQKIVQILLDFITSTVKMEVIYYTCRQANRSDPREKFTIKQMDTLTINRITYER